MNPKLQIKRASGQDHIDDPEVFQDFQRARLDALATRTCEGCFRGINQAEGNPATCEIQRKRQSCRARTNDYYLGFVHRTKIAYWYAVRMSSRKSRLTREKIATVALALADKHGFESVSMRRVAQELNVGTMSLYYYVRTKDDLISVMDDALMSEALLSQVPKNWKQAITEIATRTHSIFSRHPWALISMQSAPPGLNAMRHMEQCLEALAKTSMTAKEKLTLLAIVDDFVFGHALRETAREKEVDAEFATAQIAQGNFPRIAEVFSSGRIEIGKNRFQQGLRLLLEEYGPRRPRAASTPRRNSPRRRKERK